jgi:hypothetical protein
MLVELLGELLERQAVRRKAAGSLSDEEVERLGAAFLALHRRVDELYDELVGDDRSDWPQPFGPRSVRKMVPPTVS